MHESKPLSLLTHSSDKISFSEKLHDTYGRPCRASGNLVTCRECCRFEIVFFTLRRFLACVPSSFFQGFPEASSSTSKIEGLHADLRNIAQTRQFVWITTIKKIFICRRFNLRVRAGWPWNIILQGAFLLQNINFTKLYFWNICFLRDFSPL